MSAATNLRLLRFFLLLALKERLLPNLNVKPLVAELFLTDNCNLRCISCGCWRSTTRGELSTAEWKDVLVQLADLKLVKVNFTGGEPLIRKDAVELMRFARDVGIPSRHLNTNAIRLTTDRLAEILDAGVRSFNVSVDGPRSAYDHIRGREGAFDTTIRHLRQLLAERERYSLKIRMNFTVMRSNVAYLADIAQLAQELSVRLYLNLATDKTFLFRAQGVDREAAVAKEELQDSLSALERLARVDRRALPRYSDLRYIPLHFADIVQKDLPCAESQLKLMIHSRGEIGGCWGHDPSLNVRETRIKDVVASRAYRDEHARFFRKECVGCGSNYSLNLRWRPKTYMADALWRVGRRSLVS
jgi:AdoMet-dependent heme synthase